MKSKLFTLLSLAVLSTSCSIMNKSVTYKNWLGQEFSVEQPKDSLATFNAEVKKETLLSLKASEHPNPKMMFDPKTSVIVFEYVKKTSDTKDFYREEIYMEIPSENFSKSYKDRELEELKLIYGKHCYCDGLAGFYRIDKGNLKINHKENQMKVKLSFPEPKTNDLKVYSFTIDN